jgi:DNA-binding response OmpR family regulator
VKQQRRAHDPPRVLIAEDDPDTLELLAHVLALEGFAVHATSDGGRLLVELTRGVEHGYVDGVDLLVSDVRMPVCSGIQIVEGLRAVHCMVPVIFITGLADRQTRLQAERLGAVLLEKPFSSEALRNAATRLLAPGTSLRDGCH